MGVNHVLLTQQGIALFYQLVYLQSLEKVHLMYLHLETQVQFHQGLKSILD